MRCLQRIRFFRRLLVAFLLLASLCCLGTWLLRIHNRKPEGRVIKMPQEARLTYETLLHAQQLRRNRLKSFCSAHFQFTDPMRQKTADGALSKLVVNMKLELLYCDAPALGIEGWKHLLQILQETNVTIRTPVVSNLSLLVDVPQDGERFSRQTLSTAILQSYTKILFVRDPLERLVTAYMIQYADKMPFREFISRVLGWVSGKSMSRWQSLVTQCHPCLIRYDYIIKYSYLRRELQHLMYRMGLPQGSWDINIEDSPFLETYAWLSEKLLSELSPKQVKALFQVFQWDFSAFQFSSNLLQSFAMRENKEMYR